MFFYQFFIQEKQNEEDPNEQRKKQNEHASPSLQTSISFKQSGVRAFLSKHSGKEVPEAGSYTAMRSVHNWQD